MQQRHPSYRLQHIHRETPALSDASLPYEHPVRRPHQSSLPHHASTLHQHVSLKLPRPQNHVILQQLQYRERVLEGRLALAPLRSRSCDGLVERVFREEARALGARLDVVVVHREVEREAEPRGVRRVERDDGVLVGVLVCVERGGGVRVVRLVLGELGEVAVVVASPAAWSVGGWGQRAGRRDEGGRRAGRGLMRGEMRAAGSRTFCCRTLVPRRATRT